MSIPEVILPCPQTHSSWLRWWHCHLPTHHGLLSPFSRNVNYTFSNLLSLYPSLISAIKPLTGPRPCSSLVSMMRFFPPTFLLGINHFKTQSWVISILTVLFCLIFSLISQLSLFGVLFFPLLLHPPYQMHQELMSLCLEHAVPSKLTPTLTPAETPPLPASHAPKPSLVSPAPNASLQYHTCQTVTGDGEHADPPI